MKATMKDVAALANVGLGTVSRVINGVKVKDVTREKVEAAIAELNYEPNEYARGLKTNRTNTVALILPTIWHPFFSEYAYYVETELTKSNYKMLLCNADDDLAKERDYIQMVKQNKVDGLIAITYSDIDPFVSADLPIVSIDRHFTEDVCYVTSNNFAGGQLAAKELVTRGSKKIGFIGSISAHHNETTKRLSGFKEYCEGNAIDYAVLEMIEPINDFEQQVTDFFTANPSLDGLFVMNDLMAVDVIDYLMLETNQKIGETIQIIGFDGASLVKGRSKLLSTIAQPVQELAKVSVKNILKLISGEEVIKRSVLPVTFHEGKTTFEKMIKKD